MPAASAAAPKATRSKSAGSTLTARPTRRKPRSRDARPGDPRLPAALPPCGAGHEEGNPALPADDRRRQPRRAVRARGRIPVEEAAGAEAGFAREVRSRPGSWSPERRLRAAAALLQGCLLYTSDAADERSSV